VIEFEDGSRRILHANHLRKFYTRTQSLTYSAFLMASTNSCAIIYDSDEDFGEICVPDMVEGSKENDSRGHRGWLSHGLVVTDAIAPLLLQLCATYLS